MAENRWSLNGVVLPRSPETVQWPLVKGNVAYETMLDGTMRRLTLPRKHSGRTVVLGWTKCDARTRNALWTALASNALNKVQPSGLLPAVYLNVYFDDETKDQIADQIYDPRVGQGGFRRDIEISGIGEAYFRSVGLVPATGATQNSVNALFAGPSGDYNFDIIPAWNGVQWKGVVGSTSGSGSYSVTNMGTAPWTPTIKFIGPFATMTLNPRYLDVDGSGLGVTWTWTGGTVLTGDYVLYNTDTNRCYQSISGVLTEVYTYTLTNTNTGTPFGYYPQMPPGSFTMNSSWTGATGGTTGVDFSNNGTETFRYL